VKSFVFEILETILTQVDWKRIQIDYLNLGSDDSDARLLKYQYGLRARIYKNCDWVWKGDRDPACLCFSLREF